MKQIKFQFYCLIESKSDLKSFLVIYIEIARNYDDMCYFLESSIQR